MTKILTILGTRPEIIRLSVLSEKLDKLFTHRIVHTGQNYERTLSSVFYDELGIRKPDIILDNKEKSLGEFLSTTFLGVETELEQFNPDAVVILGDTNSALSALLAKRKGIPIYHLEAGNRAFDNNVPEEINRKIVDHFSDFNLAYTNRARENLLKEGLDSRNIAVIGSPLKEVLDKHAKRIAASSILAELEITSKNYFLLSLHRQENLNRYEKLTSVLTALEKISNQTGLPIVVSAHPRIKTVLNQLNLKLSNSVRFFEPFSYFDYVKLQLEAKIVFSDSGSVAEESSILGFPAITIRDSLERPEALEAGAILLSGTSEIGIINSVNAISETENTVLPPTEYLIPDTSNRVIRFITSTLNVFPFWSNLHKE